MLFASWQETYGKMMDALERVTQADAERGARFQQAVQTALEQMT